MTDLLYDLVEVAELVRPRVGSPGPAGCNRTDKVDKRCNAKRRITFLNRSPFPGGIRKTGEDVPGEAFLDIFNNLFLSFSPRTSDAAA
jgi:hypothetical protein